MSLNMAHDKMRSRADLNGDNLRISRAYLQISDHSMVGVMALGLRLRTAVYVTVKL